MGKQYTPKHQPHYNTVGTASWYGDKFHGRPTATGELYDMDDITAAHKTLPLNSMVYVTNLETGKGLLVRVNDRGPFVDGRIIDLSRASARRLGMFTSGLSRVRVQYAGPADPMAAKTNKRPIKRPSTPEIRKNEAPALVVELPKPALRLLPKVPELVMPKLAPEYKPLRELGKQLQTPPATQASLPIQEASPETYNNPLLGLENTTPRMQMQPTTPQSVQKPEPEPKQNIQLEDGPITLTIKGPIHMASDKHKRGKSNARFIPAVNYKVKPAKK
ncbi:MAG: septal ring lytic transglycosylase RlpA family protein [Robiginitomaculum sp.]|nr:septal ring lytic transglycosylase RlpA family protein [Robiginitomaculum sp.]